MYQDDLLPHVILLPGDQPAGSEIGNKEACRREGFPCLKFWIQLDTCQECIYKWDMFPISLSPWLCLWCFGMRGCIVLTEIFQPVSLQEAEDQSANGKQSHELDLAVHISTYLDSWLRLSTKTWILWCTLTWYCCISLHQIAIIRRPPAVLDSCNLGMPSAAFCFDSADFRIQMDSKSDSIATRCYP